MPATALETRPTGLKEAREIVKDLFTPRAAVYWTDLLATAIAGWAAFALVAALAPASPWFWGAALVAVLALYRATAFIHELTHLKKGALPGFAAAWNLLVGIPLLVPSFTYVGVHTDHHRRTVYGTVRDPEYLPLARRSRLHVAWFLVQSVFAPLLAFVRFVVAVPLALAIPRLHRWLERCATSLVINPAYRRAELEPAARRRVMAVEAFTCTLWLALIAGGLAGRVPLRFFVAWPAVGAAVALLNQLRTAAAHRFRNDGGEMDVVGQVGDSVNVPGGWLTELWAPVGLRFHALHHYLPDLPYHAFPAAHRRLSERLPPESVYHGVHAKSLRQVLATLWNEAGAAS